MLSGLTRILSRIKWWITKSNSIRKTCKGFCPVCEYYEFCIFDNDIDDPDWYEKWLNGYDE